MERSEEALRERVRETPLSERLKTCEKYVASMCAERRPPKMTIPLQHYDEDFYIYTTLADAQATIAALQARVKELEEITKVICGHCCEPMEIPSKAVLQSQLTQRTAELEAAKQNLERRTDECNEISKMYVEAQAELERVRGDVNTLNQLLRDKGLGQGEIDGMAADLEELTALRTLIAALPKVEGEIDVQRAEGLWYVWHVTPNGSQVMCGRFRRQEEAQSYVDLLQHRQGMEG